MGIRRSTCVLAYSIHCNKEKFFSPPTLAIYLETSLKPNTIHANHGETYTHFLSLTLFYLSMLYISTYTKRVSLLK